MPPRAGQARPYRLRRPDRSGAFFCCVENAANFRFIERDTIIERKGKL